MNKSDLKTLGSDDKEYLLLLERQQKEWEDRCRSCGSCCGITGGDPCEHLVEISKGTYACAVYETRFGIRKTKSGRAFKCVPIREILHISWNGDQNCGYKRPSASCEF